MFSMRSGTLHNKPTKAWPALGREQEGGSLAGFLQERRCKTIQVKMTEGRPWKAIAVVGKKGWQLEIENDTGSQIPSRFFNVPTRGFKTEVKRFTVVPLRQPLQISLQPSLETNGSEMSPEKNRWEPLDNSTKILNSYLLTILSCVTQLNGTGTHQMILTVMGGQRQEDSHLKKQP